MNEEKKKQLDVSCTTSTTGSSANTPMKYLIEQMKWGRQAEKTGEKEGPLCYCKTGPLALEHIVKILVLTATGSSAFDKQTCTRIYICKMRKLPILQGYYKFEDNVHKML